MTDTVGKPYLCQKCDQMFGSVSVYNKHVRAQTPCYRTLDLVQCFKNDQGVWTQSKGKHYNTHRPILMDGTKANSAPARITPDITLLLECMPATITEMARWSGMAEQTIWQKLKNVSPAVCFNYKGKWHKKPNPLEDIDILDRFNHWLETKVPLISGQLSEDSSLGSHLAISERIKKNVDKYYAHVVWYAYVADERKRK